MNTQTTQFKELKNHYGSHKAAAKALEVSYTRYNEWRKSPEAIPARAKNHIALAVKCLGGDSERTD